MEQPETVSRKAIRSIDGGPRKELLCIFEPLYLYAIALVELVSYIKNTASHKHILNEETINFVTMMALAHNSQFDRSPWVQR